MVFLTASCLYQGGSKVVFRASYRPEGDLTVLLEVLTAFLLLGGRELSDVGQVTLLYILVDTLQHWLLGQALYGFFLNGST